MFHTRAPWLYAACPYGLAAFHTATGELRELWGEAFARNIAVDPTGRRLIGARHRLRTNDPHRRWLACLEVSHPDEPVRERERAHAGPADGWIELVTFFADGTRFATAETARPLSAGMPRLTIRTADTGEAARTFVGPGTDAQQLALAASDELLVTCVDRRLYVFDVSDPSGRPREVTNAGRRHFTGVAFHPSGRYLAVSSNDETVNLYNATAWDVARTFT